MLKQNLLIAILFVHAATNARMVSYYEMEYPVDLCMERMYNADDFGVLNANYKAFYGRAISCEQTSKLVDAAAFKKDSLDLLLGYTLSDSAHKNLLRLARKNKVHSVVCEVAVEQIFQPKDSTWVLPSENERKIVLQTEWRDYSFVRYRYFPVRRNTLVFDDKRHIFQVGKISENNYALFYMSQTWETGNLPKDFCAMREKIFELEAVCCGSRIYRGPRKEIEWWNWN
jgi:hypothetical protein